MLVFYNDFRIDKIDDNNLQTRLDLLEVIEENPEISVEEMCRALKISEYKVNKTLAELKALFLLRRVGKKNDGQWIIFPAHPNGEIPEFRMLFNSEYEKNENTVDGEIYYTVKDAVITAGYYIENKILDKEIKNFRDQFNKRKLSKLFSKNPVFIKYIVSFPLYNKVKERFSGIDTQKDFDTCIDYNLSLSEAAEDKRIDKTLINIKDYTSTVDFLMREQDDYLSIYEDYIKHPGDFSSVGYKTWDIVARSVVKLIKMNQKTSRKIYGWYKEIIYILESSDSIKEKDRKLVDLLQKQVLSNDSCLEKIFSDERISVLEVVENNDELWQKVLRAVHYSLLNLFIKGFEKGKMKNIHYYFSIEEYLAQ